MPLVFPSQVLADRWLEACLPPDDLTALRRDNFLSWDAYKDRWYRSRGSGRPVTPIERFVLAGSLIAEEPEAVRELFGEVTPALLLRPLAGLLPGALRTAAAIRNPVHSGALVNLGRAWLDLLAEHGLSDPETISAEDLPQPPQACLVFPELLLDGARFGEGAASRLRELPSIGLDLLPRPPDHRPVFRHFQSDRDERMGVLSVLRQELERGTAPSGIAVSVAGLEQTREDLVADARLAGVPLQFRSGSPLSRSLPGLFLSSLVRAARSGFRADTVLELTGFPTVPWRDAAALAASVDRIRAAGPLGAPKPGETARILSVPGSAGTGRVALSRLIERGSALLRARSALDLRGAWSSVLDRCLESDRWSDSAKLPLQRMNDVLNGLASAEERLGTAVPEPLGRWLDLLERERYVPQSDASGIPVFDYRVLSGSPAGLHLLIGADADAVRVQAGPFGKLPPVLETSLADRIPDITRDYLVGYTGSSALHISMARFRQGRATAVPAPLLGWGFPSEPDVHVPGPDEWDAALVSGSVSSGPPDDSAAATADHGKLQAIGTATSPVLHAGLGFAMDRELAFRDAAIHAEALPLPAGENVRAVRATDLGRRVACPFAWLVTRHFHASPPEFSVLQPAQAIGSAVHAAIAEFLPAVLSGSNPEDAVSAIREHVQASLLGNRAVSAPLVAVLSDRGTEIALDLLHGVGQAWAGAELLATEQVLEGEISGLPVRGRADAILQAGDGKLVIIDFKTGRHQTVQAGLKAITEDPPSRFPEFQLQAYVLLSGYQDGMSDAAGGWHAEYRFTKGPRDGRIVASEGEGPLSDASSSPGLAPLLAACEHAARAAAEGEYAIPGDGEGCSECPIRAVCRQKYVVR